MSVLTPTAIGCRGAGLACPGPALPHARTAQLTTAASDSRAAGCRPDLVSDSRPIAMYFDHRENSLIQGANAPQPGPELHPQPELSAAAKRRGPAARVAPAAACPALDHQQHLPARLASDPSG